MLTLFLFEGRVGFIYEGVVEEAFGANCALLSISSQFPRTVFRYSVLVSLSVFIAFSPVFHSINSPNNFSLSHSVLLVLFLPSWSFQLYISL